MSGQALKDLEKIQALIMCEFLVAQERYCSFGNTHEGYAVLKEEVDEMWDAIKKRDTAGAMDEAVQVGAMALRFLFDCAPSDWLKHRCENEN